jgi:hypothetical protein
LLPTQWHLGSFYNDSEQLGGRTSSPITHGFDHMNATVEVAPTATTNCECKEEWYAGCDFGHDGGPSHCGGHGNPGGGPPLKPGCCFNYWWEDADSAHGVTNLTNPSPDNDANDYLATALVAFIETQAKVTQPFMAQISFHNCHIPFIGTPPERARCNATESCNGPLPGAAGYSSAELDFYACMNEFDEGVGTIIAALKRLGYYDNTMIWLTTDNGPEVNCGPEGRCGGTDTIPPGTLHRPASRGPGSAGPLRGRKRDVWEGGHRVPGIISWPAVAKGPARESWHPVVTMDFMATVLDVLGLQRPASQSTWAFDGVSLLPILKGETPAERGIGWMYMTPTASPREGYAYRWNQWKLAVGGISCDPEGATFNCSAPQLYNMEEDKEENHDLSLKEPAIFEVRALHFPLSHSFPHTNLKSPCAEQAVTEAIIEHVLNLEAEAISEGDPPQRQGHENDPTSRAETLAKGSPPRPGIFAGYAQKRVATVRSSKLTVAGSHSSLHNNRYRVFGRPKLCCKKLHE